MAVRQSGYNADKSQESGLISQTVTADGLSPAHRSTQELCEVDFGRPMVPEDPPHFPIKKIMV